MVFMKTAAKRDALGRADAELEADEWFANEVRKCRDARDTIKWRRASGLKQAASATHVVVERAQADGTVKAISIPIPAGLYDTERLTQVLKVEGAKTRISKKRITEALAQTRVERVVAIDGEGEGLTGHANEFTALINRETHYNFSQKRPLAGTVINLNATGLDRYEALESEAAYLDALPGLRALHSFANGWCFDIPTERVAHMASDAPAMLANLREQLSRVRSVQVYTVIPVWLRYFSDGDMDTQRSGAFGIRATHTPQGYGLRPLLYDGPAWKVGLLFGQRMLNGRVFVTPEGKFIGSDWCQREVDKAGGIDLHTGEYTKHTLMTWAAGPGMSRFGGNSGHGAVRPVDRKKVRQLLAQKTPAGTSMIVPLAVAAQKFAQGKGITQVKRAKDYGSGVLSLRVCIPTGPSTMTPIEAVTGVNGAMGYFSSPEGGMYHKGVHFIADRLHPKPKLRRQGGAVGIRIDPKTGKASLKPGYHREFNPGVTGLTDLTITGKFWQSVNPAMMIYTVDDPELREQLYHALVAVAMDGAS